jgi:hypothetical protein
MAAAFEHGCRHHGRHPREWRCQASREHRVPTSLQRSEMRKWRRVAHWLPTPLSASWSKVMKRTPGCTPAAYAVLGVVQGGEEGTGLHLTPSSWAMSTAGVEGAKGCTPAASMLPSSSAQHGRRERRWHRYRPAATPSLFVKWRGPRAARRQPRHHSCGVEREGVELHAGSPTPSAAAFMVELASSRQRRPCRRWRQALCRAP